ncbi:hypothetical protein, partial [Leptospira weilii]|uniref:hypothetical protein n=1 Tax=Leptospira weilii TaxID=28184 RepID=UPI001F1C47D8
SGFSRIQARVLLVSRSQFVFCKDSPIQDRILAFCRIKKPHRARTRPEQNSNRTRLKYDRTRIELE